MFTSHIRERGGVFLALWGELGGPDLIIFVCDTLLGRSEYRGDPTKGLLTECYG